jgi:hypothetical protein
MAGPDVQIEVETRRPDAQPGRWRVVWRVANAGSEPLRLEDAWIPHGRFRGDGHVPISAVIDPGASAPLEFVVSANEAPLTVVENAFLILRAGRWRLFARMRIEFDAHGVPRPIVETVTVQSLE